MADEIKYCPIHGIVSEKVRDMEGIQRTRPCDSHEVRLQQIEKSDDNQWEAINQLRKLVYMGAGAAGVFAFLGSIIGGLLKK